MDEKVKDMLVKGEHARNKLRQIIQIIESYPDRPLSTLKTVLTGVDLGEI